MKEFCSDWSVAGLGPGRLLLDLQRVMLLSAFLLDYLGFFGCGSWGLRK